jgi:pyruvate kinase
VLGQDGPAIIAKMETRPAVEAVQAILEVADGVMIARGDLGVEMPYEAVPLIQKRLVRAALDRGVPSIVATQMLESMIAAPRPTRAEASDVANAVFDGADAVMLSGETAIGANPVESALAAVRIVARAEADGAAYLPRVDARPATSDEDAILAAAVALTTAHAGIAAICCVTRTGRTALRLAALRPGVPIIAVSPDPGSVARLAIVNGVVARHAPGSGTGDQLGQLRRWLETSGLVGGLIEADAAVVLVAAADDREPSSRRLAIERIGSVGTSDPDR